VVQAGYRAKIEIYKPNACETKKEHKNGINRRRTYLYCGCMWITIRPMWLVVGGCSQECTVGSGPAVTVR
jgi:hypothetical protein